ncbi:MAG: DapH/DapD/GlmU-related protein [Acidobacteriota bacterium]
MSEEHPAPGAPTSLHATARDERVPAWTRYQDLAVGTRALWDLLKYEIVTGLFGDMPGALGLLMRRTFYPAILGAMGKNVTLGKRVTVRHPAKIRIGSGVIVADDVVLDAYGTGGSGGIELGDDVLIGRGSTLSTKGGAIRIGPRTNVGAQNIVYARDTEVVLGAAILVAANGYIMGGGVHGYDRTDVPIMDQHVAPRGVRIGDGCWLGASVMVADGVTIGPECVIGAGSFVKEDVPAWSVAYGVPARVARSRKAGEPA